MASRYPGSTVQVLCCSVSLCVSLWAGRLLRGRRPMAQHRLFWLELALLSFAVFSHAVFSVAFGVLYMSKVLPPQSCAWLWLVRGDLEFTLAFLEVHIAAGFLAACRCWDRAVRLLRWALVLCFVLPGIITVAFGAYVELASPNEIHDVTMHCFANVDARRYGRLWDWTILTSAACTLLLYCGCCCCQNALPAQLRRRTMLRTALYVSVFSGTLGLRAVWQWDHGWLGRSEAANIVTSTLMNFNGVLILGMYLLCVSRAESTTVPCAQEELDVGALEHYVIGNYFDLPIDLDDDVAEARRLVLTSIIMAQSTRDTASQRTSALTSGHHTPVLTSSNRHPDVRPEVH